ncbi:MAG: hypothetical protein M3Q30_11015 [Actinomycetota bacterium]|nr:hypothetical protein [Actinomycetota bacterium]
MTEPRDPQVGNYWRAPRVLGAIMVVFCWYAFGLRAVVFLALIPFAVILALAWSASPINLCLLGTQREADTLLHACASLDRRSGRLDIAPDRMRSSPWTWKRYRDGTLDIAPDRLRWSPWKRYRNVVAPIDVSAREIERAVLYTRKGFPGPGSVRLELQFGDGATSLVVRENANRIAHALRAM